MLPSKELAGLAGFVALILSYFKVDIGEGEIQALIGAILVTYTILKSWYDRYRKGEINLGGLYRAE